MCDYNMDSDDAETDGQGSHEVTPLFRDYKTNLSNRCGVNHVDVCSSQGAERNMEVHDTTRTGECNIEYERRVRRTARQADVEKLLNNERNKPRDCRGERNRGNTMKRCNECGYKCTCSMDDFHLVGE